jgi:hypothetical protein
VRCWIKISGCVPVDGVDYYDGNCGHDPRTSSIFCGGCAVDEATAVVEDVDGQIRGSCPFWAIDTRWDDIAVTCGDVGGDFFGQA